MKLVRMVFVLAMLFAATGGRSENVPAMVATGHSAVVTGEDEAPNGNAALALACVGLMFFVANRRRA